MTAGAIIGLAAACGLLLIIAGLTGEPRPSRSTRRPLVARLAATGGVSWLTGTRFVGATIAAGVLVGVVAILVSGVLVVGVIGAALGAYAPLVLLRRVASKRTRQQQSAWPDAVDALVSGIRAGMSLPDAVGALADRGPAQLRPAFSTFVAEYRATGSFAVALDALETLLSDPVADRVVASLRIARDVGGADIGLVLRALSVMLREDARIRGEIAGRQSWTVSAARVAVAAPWITLALLCTRPAAIASFRSPAGAAVLVGAAIVSVVAYALMMRVGRLPAEQRLKS